MTWLDELTIKKNYGKMLQAQLTDWKRTPPKMVAGADEAGRGAIAGPLSACAVLAPLDWYEPYLDDSKDLTPASREDAAYHIFELARAGFLKYWVVTGTKESIETLGIDAVNKKCLEAAFSGVASKVYTSVMQVADGTILTGDQKIISLPKADTLVPHVMAASIVAKHTRDSFMRDMAEHFPEYGFDQHNGYGTTRHLAAVEKHGPCELHRMTFAPFKDKGDDPTDEKDHRPADEAGGGPEQGPPDAEADHRNIRKKRRAPKRPSKKASGRGGARRKKR